LKAVNSFQAIRVFVGMGVSPSKMGPFAPFLATIQPLSSTRAFLYTQKKSRMLCMGCTFTVARPVPTYLMKRTVEFQLEIEPARQVKVQNITRAENIQFKY
jgi:hypothetical protein